MAWRWKFDGNYSLLYETCAGEDGFFEFSKNDKVMSMHEVFDELVYLSERCEKAEAMISKLSAAFRTLVQITRRSDETRPIIDEILELIDAWERKDKNK